ncbi:MAG: hypothetical protein ACI97N_001406 [Cognaticolwellia sp.]|jgi:hypothetical protein
MNYNTSRTDIVIPEYGRNIQLLIEHSKTIEDREERQAFVETIVDLIQQLHPQARNIDDYVAKLWSHVFRIADYELDVTPPCEILTKEEVYKRPDALPYPGNDVKFRHYGRNIQEMVSKAIEMEDEEMQGDYVQVIGSYMKMAYNTWNRNDVSDDMIRKNLVDISDGKLELEEDTNIDSLINPQQQRRRTSTSSSSRSPIRKSTSSSSRMSRSTNSSSARPKRSNSSINKRRRK